MIKKSNTFGALALVMAVSSPAAAADPSAAPAAPPQFQPTPGMATMMTLGSGGLLMPLLSEDVFASQQARIGNSRTTDGDANARPAGVPKPSYRDMNTTFVGAVSLMKEIPVETGAAFIRLSTNSAWSGGSIKTPLDSISVTPRVMAQAFYAPNTSQLFGLGVVYDHLDVKSKITADPFGSYTQQIRSTVGFQLFYAQQFSPFWGIAAKSEMQRGELTVDIDHFLAPGVPLVISETQSDNRFYNEFNLVGNFSSRNSPWMIEGWVAHPLLGATFQRNFLGNTTNSVHAPVYGGPAGSVENYGLLMTNLRIEKAPTPGPDLQFLPDVTLGFEHEYVDTDAVYLKEPNYAVVGAGVGVMTFGQRVDLEYKIRQGLTGRRQFQAVVLSTSFNF